MKFPDTICAKLFTGLSGVSNDECDILEDPLEKPYEYNSSSFLEKNNLKLRAEVWMLYLLYLLSKVNITCHPALKIAVPFHYL